MNNYSKEINSYDRIGPEHMHAVERRAILSDWTMESGVGYSGLSSDVFPEHWRQFVHEQFQRFKVPVTPLVFRELTTQAADAIIHVIDYWDPYAMLYRVTDVTLDFKWESHTFVVDGSEVDASELDTYRLEPGLSRQTLEECLSKPGLGAIPHFIGDQIKEALDGDCYDIDVESPAGCLSQQAFNELNVLCMQNGVINTKMRANYFYLSAWASWCWLLTPQGMRMQVQGNEIMAACYQYGECIMYDGNIYTPDVYKVIERPPRTCGQCGLNAWCVEMISEDGGNSWCCEKCLHAGMPPIAPNMCATKFCKYTKCPHHPFHSMDEHASGMFSRKHGQLNWLVRGDPEVKKAIQGGRVAPMRLE